MALGFATVEIDFKLSVILYPIPAWAVIFYPPLGSASLNESQSNHNAILNGGGGAGTWRRCWDVAEVLERGGGAGTSEQC